MSQTPADIIITIAQAMPISNALDTSSGLWALTQINHLWRTVIRRQPLLWRNLRFDAVSSNLDRRDHEQRTAAEALRLSGTLLLSFTYRDSLANHNDPGSTWLIVMLTRESFRWRRAHLTFNLAMHFTELSRLHSSGAGALEQLQIATLFDTAPEDVFTSQLMTFFVAPSLRDLTLAFSSENIQMLFPLTQLTTYRELGGPNLIASHTHEYLLPRIPNVNHLVLTWDNDDNDAHESSNQYPLPSLRTLLTHGAEVLDLVSRAPLLEELQVIETTSDSVTQIPPLIDRSQCFLRTLILHFVGDMSDGDLVVVLRDLPTLTYLQISADDYDRRLVDVMIQIPLPNQQFLLPNLESLTIMCSGDSSEAAHAFNEQAVNTMLINRVVGAFSTVFISIAGHGAHILSPALMTTISMKARQNCRVIVEYGVRQLHEDIFQDSEMHSLLPTA